MKDTKSLTLLLLSSVLFLLSIILLCTWGYQYYHQIQEDKSKSQQAVKAPSSVTDDTRDSLLKIYKVTLNSLDNTADTAYYVADSINGKLNINLQEFYRLRDEIAVLLQAQTPKTEDLLLAKKKVTELQQKLEQLRFHNTDVEAENKRLKNLIDQLSRAKNNPQEGIVSSTSAVQEYINSDKPEAVPVKMNAAPGTISAVNLNLNALTAVDNNEVVTTQATAAEKLVGSFTIKNNAAGNSWCDLVVVVTNPEGRVIQKSAWESGTFETKQGKRIYSMKIRCETGKGESKQLNFSLSPDSYQKGIYTMQVYHNGVVIGRFSKTLS